MSNLPDEPTGPVAASQHRLRSARRLLRRKDRRLERTFLAEGRQAVREALRASAALEVYVSDRAAHADLLDGAGVPVWIADQRDLSALSDTVTPQGIVAVCGFLDVAAEQVLTGDPRLLVACASVRDPGNAGTVIRCADAFGADGVLFSSGSVEVYNPKTVRASVGSLFHLPLAVEVDLGDLTRAARTSGMQVLAADGNGDADLPDLAADGTLQRPTMWLLGNEAWGLPEADRALADRVVSVPIYGQAESLNLSTAAAVCLYASATAQRPRSEP